MSGKSAPPNKKGCEGKICKEGKICNPKTGRCGKKIYVEKELLKQTSQQPVLQEANIQTNKTIHDFIPPTVNVLGLVNMSKILESLLTAFPLFEGIL